MLHAAAAKLPESSAILFMNSFESPSEDSHEGLFNFKTRPRPHKAIGEVKVLWHFFFGRVRFEWC